MCHTNVVNRSIGRLAPPVKRLGAHFVDLLVPVVALFLIIGVAAAGAATGTEGGFGLGALLGFAMFAGYVIWAIKLFASGTTPGKKLLGMRVVKEDGSAAGFGTMLVREWLGKWISALVLSLGFLWILFDKDHQGWHDKLMSTYVVH
jgi:uncharacterized RDD family membrane protein YckC